MSEIKSNNIKNAVWILLLLAIALGLLLTIKNLTNPGDLDKTFNGDGKLSTDIGAKNERAEAIAIQSDGKIVVVGDYYNVWKEDDDWAVVRYTPDGTLDTAFAGKGYLTIDLGDIDQAWDVGIQPDGKIIIAGQTCNTSLKCKIALARYDDDGNLDPSFSEDGKLTTDFGAYDRALDVSIQTDGKIVVAGKTCETKWICDLALARYNSNVTLDTTFHGDGMVNTGFGSGRIDVAKDLAIASGGKLVVVGTTCDSSFVNCNFAIARFNPNGSLDTTFSGDGKVVSNPIPGVPDATYGLAIQSNGKLVVAGMIGNDGSRDLILARYNPIGSLDNTFSGNGWLTTDFGGDDCASDIAIQSDGRLVVVGRTNAGTGADWDFALARYLP